MQDIEAVVSPAEHAPVTELARRPRHRGRMRGDQAREQVVGEVHRDHARVAVSGAPSAGEVPEKRLEADVGADELTDRERQGERSGAADGTGDERRGDVRPAADERREPVIEDRDARRLEDLPLRAGGERLGVLGLPGDEQVAAPQ